MEVNYNLNRREYESETEILMKYIIAVRRKRTTSTT